MKTFRFLVMLSATVTCLLSGTLVKAGTTNSFPPELRQGNFQCEKATIQIAVELKHAGWTYIMPEPKSPQAAWGHKDGRTTWWIGYWVNGRDDSTSLTQPRRNTEGKLVGDGGGGHLWRRGGSPPPPSKIEWLCSTHGGIPPQ